MNGRSDHNVSDREIHAPPPRNRRSTSRVQNWGWCVSCLSLRFRQFAHRHPQITTWRRRSFVGMVRVWRSPSVWKCGKSGSQKTVFLVSSAFVLCQKSSGGLEFTVFAKIFRKFRKNFRNFRKFRKFRKIRNLRNFWKIYETFSKFSKFTKNFRNPVPICPLPKIGKEPEGRNAKGENNFWKLRGRIDVRRRYFRTFLRW